MTDDRDEPEDNEELPDLDNMTDEERFEWVKSVLEKLPPEVVREEMIRRGLVGVAATALQEVAQSDDPLAREDARAVIRDYGLELLLVDEAALHAELEDGETS